MASIERTAYPRLKGPLTQTELAALYEPTDEELHFVRQHAYGHRGRLALLVLLKGHQNLGRVPGLRNVPQQVQHYLCDALSVPRETPLRIDTRQARHRYRQAIRDYLGVRAYVEGGREVAEAVVQKAAYTMSDPADLVNVAVERLIQERYELPAFGALDRLVGRVRHRVHEELYDRITGRLSSEERRRLDGLLEVAPSENVTDFTRLKETPRRATLKQMHLWAERLDGLQSILETERLLTDVAHTKIRQFAAEALALEVGDVRDILNAAKRHALLVCLLHQA